MGGKLTAAQKENEFVYHEKVPPLSSLPEVKGASLVKGISFNINDPEVSGPDIFARLVPLEAHRASSMYRLVCRVKLLLFEKKLIFYRLIQKLHVLPLSPLANGVGDLQSTITGNLLNKIITKKILFTVKRKQNFCEEFAPKYKKKMKNFRHILYLCS